ncbi:ThiF family adenylyltransferase [Pseudomonas sp. PD9R]|uniref:ThiF family adenylyltransferase n=1 Tax=Pseudomonas sp. PD9R TaxID=2853534 RepID=UPI001C46AD37|nr:ThiF family adenylyltransferase [Pseudomonas sp. PD9R]MBV6824222.1 ThiF family adenylyltransferase [Pseudomonas sp. PD9R]
MSLEQDITLDDYIFLNERGKAIGIIAPSTLYCLMNNTTYINGPDSIIKLNQQSIPALTEGLITSGSLIEGTPSEINEVVRLLKNPDTSRNTSFFMCIAKNCGQILKDSQSLQDSKILIVGCGGIGSSVALLLAGCGVKSFTLVDSDTIEKSNLNRQLFWRKKDIGKYKVLALKAAIEERFDSTKIETINRKLSFDDLLQLSTIVKYTTIVVTADDPATLAARCGELSKKTSTPVVSGGYLHTHCSANFFSGDTTQSEFDLHEDAEHWQRLPTSVMPSFGPMNFSIASLLAYGVISFIATESFQRKKTLLTQWNASHLPTNFNVFDTFT